MKTQEKRTRARHLFQAEVPTSGDLKNGFYWTGECNLT
jgi:hypothetical protein